MTSLVTGMIRSAASGGWLWVPGRHAPPVPHRGMMVGVTNVPGLLAATEELYVGPPVEFVARRDELARRARVSGDRALAAAIKALRRPTVGAWYVNVGSRAGLTSLREWLRLGRQLRQTQEAGDFAVLRELAVRRVPLEGRVLRDLAAHLAQLGVAATPAGLEEVRVTLGAALADPAAEALVAAGRVDRPLAYAGFGIVDVRLWQAGVVSTSGGEGTAEQPQEDEEAERLDALAAERTANEQAAAARDLAAAEHDLAAVIARREAAEARVHAARDRAALIAADLVRAQGEVSSAEGHAADLQAEERAISLRIEHARGVLRP